MELYYVIAITDRDKAERMASLFQNAGLHMVQTKLAQGTATDEHLSLYGLDETEKAIISAVSTPNETTQLLKAAKRKMFIDIPGNGIMLAIPIKAVAGGRTLAQLANAKETGGVPSMNFEYELIVVILNENFADCVMEAARSAGAGGGTVLHAKGTAGAHAGKFYGVSIAEEKDVIYIVAHKDEKAAIMQAISTQAGPGSKANSICFSLPISSVVGLRDRDT